MESVSLSNDHTGCFNLSSTSAFSCFLLLIPQAAYFSRLAESAAPSLFIVNAGSCRWCLRFIPTRSYRRALLILRVVFPCRSPRDGLGGRKGRAGTPAGSLGQCLPAQRDLFSAVFSFTLFSHLTLSFCLLYLIPPLPFVFIDFGSTSSARYSQN